MILRIKNIEARSIKPDLASMIKYAQEASVARENNSLIIPQNTIAEILYYYPNPFYGTEINYILDGDFYKKPDRLNVSFHKDCFSKKEHCLVIGTITARDKNLDVKITFNAIRFMQKEERDDLHRILNTAYDYYMELLEKDKEDED